MEGMKRTVNGREHRQEIVAGNMQGYLLSSNDLFKFCPVTFGDQTSFQQSIKNVSEKLEIGLAISL